MNHQQSEFAIRAMQQLRQVIDDCCENGSSATVTLGRRRVGRHIVVVTIVAEIDNGFSAPLSSHASRSHAGKSREDVHKDGTASLGTPDYSVKTKHHNRHRTHRWHKPVF